MIHYNFQPITSFSFFCVPCKLICGWRDIWDALRHDFPLSWLVQTFIQFFFLFIHRCQQYLFCLQNESIKKKSIFFFCPQSSCSIQETTRCRSYFVAAARNATVETDSRFSSVGENHSHLVVMLPASSYRPFSFCIYFDAGFLLTRVFLLLNAQEFELTWQVQRPVQLINKMTKWRGPEPWRLIGCETARSMPLLFNSQETLLQTTKYLYI